MFLAFFPASTFFLALLCTGGHFEPAPSLLKILTYLPMNLCRAHFRTFTDWAKIYFMAVL